MIERMTDLTDDEVVDRLTSFRQYMHNGQRVPHKPLLVLLALGNLDREGTSAIPWSVAEQQLADLITEFGPPSRTSRPQSAAYPFTRLRSDGIWTLDSDVPDDNLGPLRAGDVTGRLGREIEDALRERPSLISTAARRLVEAQFPMTVAPDVLTAVGLDPDYTLGTTAAQPARSMQRRRSSAWVQAILDAWDRQCAFCGYDGQLGGAIVGIEAAHVRWFNLGGPDVADNGLALCALHHKLLDRGALGLSSDYRIQVSAAFSARTDTGKRVYELHDRPVGARPGTALPRPEFVAWHTTQVFKGLALSA
jgi:putative restriction endonuclease